MPLPQLAYNMIFQSQSVVCLFVCLFDLILYTPVNNFSVMWDGSFWVEPVLSKNKCVLLKDTTQ